MFADLSRKKLILVSGKGGVGKTTISAALAWHLSQAGRKVLLATIDCEDQIPSLFDRKPMGYEPSPLRPQLSGINITARKAFEEYVVRQIMFHSIYSAVFDNKYVRAFIEGTPGMAELMCIGKVYDMVDEYDTIVLDAPATGHGKSLLQVPTVVAEAVRVGPLKTNSEKIEALLKDSTKTGLLIVSLAEEMPVEETLELREWIQSHLGIEPTGVIINGLFTPLFPHHSDQERCETFFREHNSNPVMEGLRHSYYMRMKRSELHAHYTQQLQEQLKGLPTVEIPFYFCESIGTTELKDIGERIESHEST